MSHPDRYSKDWLKKYCDSQGTEHAVEKLDFDKIEDLETRELFEQAFEAFELLHARLAKINKHLGIQ